MLLLQLLRVVALQTVRRHVVAARLQIMIGGHGVGRRGGRTGRVARGRDHSWRRHRGCVRDATAAGAARRWRRGCRIAERPIGVAYHASILGLELGLAVGCHHNLARADCSRGARIVHPAAGAVSGCRCVIGAPIRHVRRLDDHRGRRRRQRRRLLLLLGHWQRHHARRHLIVTISDSAAVAAAAVGWLVMMMPINRRPAGLLVNRLSIHLLLLLLLLLLEIVVLVELHIVTGGLRLLLSQQMEAICCAVEMRARISSVERGLGKCHLLLMMIRRRRRQRGGGGLRFAKRVRV